RLSFTNYNTTLSSDSLETGTGSSNSLRSSPSGFGHLGESLEIRWKHRPDDIQQGAFNRYLASVAAGGVVTLVDAAVEPRIRPIHNARSLIPQRLLKVGRVKNDRPRGSAQAVDRVIWQMEGSRQLIKVIALGLVL